MKRFLVFFFLSLSLVTIAAETQKIAIVNLEKVFDNYYKRAIAEEFFQQQSDIYRNYIVKQQQAQEKLQVIIRQMQKAESVTETMKESNQWEGIQRMNSICNRAEEIVLRELIYNNLLEDRSRRCNLL